MSHSKYLSNSHYPPSDCLDMRPAQIARRMRKGCVVDSPCGSNKCTACRVATGNFAMAHMPNFSYVGDGTGLLTCLMFSIWPKRCEEAKLLSVNEAVKVLVLELLESVGVADRAVFLQHNFIIEYGREVFVQIHTDQIPQNQWCDLQKNLMRAGKKHRIYLHGNGIANYFFGEFVNGDKNFGSNINLHATL